MQLDQIPMMKKTIPGISTCLGPGLVTREGEDRNTVHLKTWRSLPCFLERAVRNNYYIFPTKEKHHKTKLTQWLLT